MSFLKRLFNLFLTISFLFSLLPQWEAPKPVPISPAYDNTPDIITPVSGVSASYPYGNDRLYKFIKNQLKWPVKDFCGEGTVVISFIIDEKGYPSSYEIRRGFHEAFDQEALRVLKMIKKWKPGRDHQGNPIAMQMNMPIRFAL